MGSIPDHLRREGAALSERIGPGGLAVHIAIIAVFGVVFPWIRPSVFLEPVVIAAYACLGVLFAAPAVAQGFGMKRPQSMNEVVARLLLAVTYGELMTGLILAAAFATIYATRPYVLAPDVGTLLSAGFFGLTASLAMAAVAGWMTLALSAASARRLMRVVFLVLLFLFFFRSGWLPDVAGEAALVSLAIAAAGLLGLRRAL
ncbi:MAG TPA: hypothetical protein VMB85_25575 [Bryobacteraceae bacterium]|nr:hypothetical protein [Bryobacteraceae bacterium]